MRANWGGKRIGSGRKRKTTAQRAAKVLAHPSSPTTPPTTNEPSPVEEFDAPDALLFDERQVWLKQAPHAFKERTLTRATAMAFETYCRVVVMERNESKGSGVGGPNHRGLLKLIQSYEVYFRLIADGKPRVEPVPVVSTQVDENEAFFGDSHGVKRG